MSAHFLYSSCSIMYGDKFLSHRVRMRSLFFLRSYNTFSWCLLKFPVDFSLLDLYRVQSYLENFSSPFSTYGGFLRGGRM